MTQVPLTMEVPSRAPSRPEMFDITLAKGLGIVLVVIGHILARGHSEGNDWFVHVKDGIYLFHMPFFMFLSGYVFFRPGRIEGLRKDYAAFFNRVSVRLLLPFVGMGVGILTLKLVMQHVVHVDNVPESFASGLRNLLWTTDKSPSIFVWYILALYLYNILSPWLHKLLGERMHLWVALGFALFLLPDIHRAYLDKITLYFLFFTVGGWLRHREEAYCRIVDQFLPFWVVLFAASFSVGSLDVLPWKYCLLISGSCSIPALHGICRRMVPHLSGWASLIYLFGISSFSIYLFNTLAIGATKAVIFKFADWHYGNFFWVAPLLIQGGLFLPILAERFFLARIPFIGPKILSPA